ncbi:MAG: tetratricopeptide repeat protein [Planctomycetes bacterium]|nr:tetratricopeptide repeat protein [Planctomycetota bacterium]
MSTAAARTTQRWLFGPWRDLVLGCGLGYAAIFVVMAALGATFREALPLGIAFLPVNLVSSAHYGATAVRAYERFEDRQQYWLFTTWTTLALGACFVWGLASVAAGSWFVTIYLTWSPWHYALQNFGVAMTFLRRRAVDVTPGARRLLHASFVLSFFLAAIALHSSAARASYAPNQLESGVYSFIPLGPMVGLSHDVANALLLVTGCAWLGTTVGAVVLLRRAATLRDLAPALVLVAVQALWFSVPVLARQFGVFSSVEPFSVEHAAYAFLWIGAGHAVQYLWITAYFAKSAGRSASHTKFVTKSLLAGTALWWVPAILFAPGLLGRLPYDAGLAAMVAALVNLHHFILDGVIWKLRDGRVAQALLGRAPRPLPPIHHQLTGDVAPRRWVRGLLWTGGALVLAGAVASALLTEFGFNRPYERGDLDAARRAADRLEWLGQSSDEMRLRLGHTYLDRNDLSAARSSLERSIEIRPTAWGWTGLGDTHARNGEWREAADAYAKALEIEPDHAVATFGAGLAALEMSQAERARRALHRAKALAAADRSAPEGLLEAIEGALADPRLEEPRANDRSQDDRSQDDRSQNDRPQNDQPPPDRR